MMFILYWLAAARHPIKYRRHQAYVREQNKYLDGLPYDETIYKIEEF